MIVPHSKPELRELFGRNYFEPGWETSYQYRNELLNYRRVEYDDEQFPAIDWWQVHIRGYPHDSDGNDASSQVELTAHYEPEPVEYPDAHVSTDYIDLDRGMESMQEVLDARDIDYEFVPATE